MTIANLKRNYLAAKEAYYNGTPKLTDAAFDKLEDSIRAVEPKWEELGKTGVKVKNKKTEVALTHFMPSLSKAYPTDMVKWLDKHQGPYTVMDKLDGSSIQVEYLGGKPVKVVTRGDGTRGGDISFLIPHLNLPKVKVLKPFVLRCEALMDKLSFDKRWSKEFDNSRNAVNGLLNRRTAHPALKDVRIVVLGVFKQQLREGLAWAKLLGFDVVAFGQPKNVTAASLTALLSSRKSFGTFEVDGLVMAPSSFMVSYTNADKPKGIVAFKFNDEENAAVVTVKKIIWQVTGRSRIVPKIEIEPTKMDGVMVTYCAAHNAQWMTERNIGPGAKVKVLRSGGVIPKIVEVVKPGKFQKPDIDYTVDGVHFVVAKATKATNSRIAILNIVKFMKTLKIDLIAGKTAASLYAVGLTSPVEFVRSHANGNLGMKLHEAGFAGKQGVKILDEIARVFNAPILMRDLIVASQCFGVGIGDRKLQMIEAAGVALDEVFVSYDLDRILALSDVPGFGEKTALVVKKGFPAWAEFFKSASRTLTVVGELPKKKKAVAGKLSGKRVSFTGYRDAEHEAYIVANGGEVVSFGSKTNVLLFKAGGKSSSKVNTAIEKGIPAMTFLLLQKLK
jgi:DNA ligase (NAD+)